MKYKNKIYENLFVFSIIFAYLLCVFFNYYYGKIVMDSDMASEMVLANILNSEGKLITESFFYATELRIFSLQLFYKITLSLFPNDWHMAKTLAQAMVMAMLSLSAVFFSYSIGFKKKGLYIVSILLLPMGLWYTFHNYFNGFYVFHTVPVLLITGMTFYLMKNKNVSLFHYLVFGIMCVFSGMNYSIKILMYSSLPSIFVSFTFLFGYLNKNGFDKKNIFKTDEFRFFAISIFNGIATSIGTILYYIICNIYDFTTHFTFVWSDFSILNLLEIFSFYLKNFGYPSNEFFAMDINIFSKPGIFGTFGVFTMLAFMFSLHRLNRNFKNLTKYNQFIVGTCVSQIFIVSLILCCCYKKAFEYGYYLLPLIPAGLVLMEIEIDTDYIRTNEFRYVIRLLLLLNIGLSSISTLSWYTCNFPRRNSLMDNAVIYLDEQNIDKIYAKFWDGNVTTALTNGRVESYVVDDIYTLEMLPWLQSRSHMEGISGDFYVLIEKEIISNCTYKKDGVEIIYCDNYSIIHSKDYDTYVDFIFEFSGNGD